MSTQATFLDDFPRRLKWMRAQAKWSQAELAEKVGVARTFITLIESGQRMPSFNVANLIVKALTERVGPRKAKQGWFGELPT